MSEIECKNLKRMLKEITEIYKYNREFAYDFLITPPASTRFKNRMETTIIPMSVLLDAIDTLNCDEK
jgi:hypothetical protein